MINLVFDGEPIPQGRPRASYRGGRVHVRDTDKSRNYKNYIRTMAQLQYKGKPLEGALQAHVDVYRPIPKSTSNVRREKKENKEIRPIVRPDLDNYIKSIFDGLDKITWNDDAQVVELSASKFYSINPRVEIIIKELG